MDEIPYSLEEPEPAPAALPPSGPLRLGPAPRALRQRLALLWVLAGLFLAGFLMALRTQAALPGWPWFQGVLAFGFCSGLWGIRKAARAPSLAGREVFLSGHALEVRRGAFRRLVVFESIRHLCLLRTYSGRLVSLRLDLEDDSVTLRDVDGLARIFETAAQGRPPGDRIELQECRVDWVEPLPWMVMALLAALAAGLAVALDLPPFGGS